MQRTILHIDFDSFFASCEQQYNQKLRNKPIGVTATNGRTCIIAASREAKLFGIKTGTRTFEARKLCPQIIFIPASFVKYLDISKKFLNICKDYSPFVELFSIDEVFMDITKTIHLFNNTDNIIHLIKNRIKKEIGEYITVSVGVSHNKLLAKLASSVNKPNGLFKIKYSDIGQIYKNSQLTDVCGIGERIKARLNQIGVYDLLKLRKIPLATLVAEFGPVQAQFLKNVSLGIDYSEVIPYTTFSDIKSVGRNYCLPKNEYNEKIVLQNVYELCEEVGIKLRRLDKKARTVGISLRGSLNIHGRKTFQDYFDCGKEIFEKCRMLINKDTNFAPPRHSGLPAPRSLGEVGSRISSWLDSGVATLPRMTTAGVVKDKKYYVRQISVWVSSLEDKNNLPLSLFSATQNSLNNERLLKAIDSINDRFGDHTIRNGFLLYTDKLTTVPNGYMADKYERTKIASDSL